jgi:hypothetical protein
VSLVCGAERGLLADIQKLLPEPLEQVTVPGFEPTGRGGEREGRPPMRRSGGFNRSGAAPRGSFRPGASRGPRHRSGFSAR